MGQRENKTKQKNHNPICSVTRSKFNGSSVGFSELQEQLSMELFTKKPYSAHKICRYEPKPKCHPHRWVNTKQCLSCLPFHNSNSHEKKNHSCEKQPQSAEVSELFISVLSLDEWSELDGGWDDEGQKTEAAAAPGVKPQAWRPSVDLRIQSPH